MCISTAMTSCVSPHPFTQKQSLDNFQANLNALNIQQHKLSKKLSIDEAIARSLKYNLDYRVQQEEEGIALADMGVANANMLPNLMASAGYVSRNNVNAVISPETPGQIATSEDQNRELGDLSFSWNILDFGVSYFESKQKADQVLIAQERERKVANRLSKDTQKAFWRTVAAQHYLIISQGYKDQLLKTIQSSIMAQKSKLISPLEGARLRRDLWVIYNQMTNLNFELSKYQPELMSLMNAPINENVVFDTDESQNTNPAKNLPRKIYGLEKMALYFRPELIEENYRKRIGLNEINRARMRMIPGLEISYGTHYDSNSFLVNNNWNLLSSTLSWNIFKLLSSARQLHLAKLQANYNETRRLALSLAIITQVDIAKIGYNYAKTNLYINDQILKNEKMIYQNMLNRGNRFENNFQLTKARGAYIIAQIKRDLAYADFQTAASELVDSIGLSPVFSTDEINFPLDRLTQMVHKESYFSMGSKKFFTDLLNDTFKINSLITLPPPAISNTTFKIDPSITLPPPIQTHSQKHSKTIKAKKYA